MFLEKLLEERL